MSEIITALIGLPVALLTAYFGFRFGMEKMRQEHHREISMELWQLRSKYYLDLLALMRVVPKYPSRIGQLKVSEIKELEEKTMHWYFDGGGLYLSTASRERFMDVKKYIAKHYPDHSDSTIDKHSEYTSLIKVLSALRTELTRDLLSRERRLL